MVEEEDTLTEELGGDQDVDDGGAMQDERGDWVENDLEESIRGLGRELSQSVCKGGDKIQKKLSVFVKYISDLCYEGDSGLENGSIRLIHLKVFNKQRDELFEIFLFIRKYTDAF